MGSNIVVFCMLITTPATWRFFYPMYMYFHFSIVGLTICSVTFVLNAFIEKYHQYLKSFYI